VYDDPAGLKITLESLSAQTYNRSNYEIIVVNDGGNLEISHLCTVYDVRELKIIPNKGSYNARNYAVAHARGEILAFADADIKVPANWLRYGLEAVKKADYVAGPVKIDRSEKMTIAEMYEYYTAFDIKKYMERYKFGVTANLFVSRKIFSKIGKFDEELRSSGDLEFGDRVHRYGGFKQEFVEKLAVHHPPRKYNDLVKKIKRGCIGQIMLKKKYPDRFNFIRLDIIYIVLKSFIPPRILNNVIHQDRSRIIQLYVFSWYIKFIKSYFLLKYKFF
jgi:glycosyltransferase AglI